MLAAAVWCVVAFWGLLVLAYYVKPTSWLDAAALHGFVSIHRPKVDGIATALAHSCNPLPYAIACLAVIAVALKTRGLRTAALIGVFLVGANATSQALKPALAYHRELYHSDWHLYNLADAAYPSGHATAAMSISLAVLMVTPRAYRPLVAALGAAFTVAVSFALLILQWHFPSDIVGGYLVATTWGFVSIALLGYINERWPDRGTVRVAAREAMPTSVIAITAWIALAIAFVGAVIAGMRAREIASFAERHTAAAAVASAIVVAAALLLAAVVAISSRSRSRSRSR
jgi:membrane-associated phospholipid phosphatase